MNCKYFKIVKRNNKREKRIYYKCSLLKKEITFDNCSGCTNKEYKILKTTMDCENTIQKHTKCTKYSKNSALNGKKYGLNKKSPVITGHKHKLTKATEIPIKVKKEVWIRDNCCCIYCHKPVPLFCANSHYIKRSQLGLGIPQNIVTACPNCHNKYDFGINVQDMINYTREYLKSKYEVWNEDMLRYKK